MAQNESQMISDLKGSGKGWLSSHMAQFMVFLNGLILTLTAFFTLSIFINEMQSESFYENTGSAFNFIQGDLGEIERSVNMIGSMIEDKNVFDTQNLEELVPNIEVFEGIRFTNLNRNSNSFEIYKSIPDGFQLNYEYDLSQTSVSAEFFSPSAESSAIYLVLHKPLFVNDERHLLTAFINFETLIPGIIEQHNMPIDHVEVQDINQRSILVHDNSEQKQTSYNESLNESWELTIADKQLILNAQFQKDQRTSFLEKIPFLMLLFGITLTLIGTLYVRNNQKQSQKLAQMNRVLAMKNLELNNEVLTREKLNKMIRKSEKENRSVLNAVSDIIFEADKNGNILFLNAAWHRITGFDSKAYIGKSLIDMLHPQDRDEQKEKYDNLIRNNLDPYRVYTRLRTHNGTFRAIELAISMLRYDDKDEMRVVGTITDVEERRRAERALSEAEKKYRTIVENAAGGIYQITPEGHFLSVNPSLAKIFGYDTPEQMLRSIKNANEEIYLDKKVREAFIRKVSINNGTLNFETKAICKDGAHIWISENMRAVKSEDGDILYYEGSIEDISARKVAEESLKEAKIRSDLANRAKSEFLANMSHELRTPLNAIIGFSEIIKNQVFGPIGQEAYHDYARDIHESGKKLLEVINNILDVSRIEVGERQLNESLVDIQKVIPMCLKLMEPKFEAKKLKVAFDKDKVYPKVIGEELAIKQMMMNLLSNAIKYSSENGLVTVACDVDKDTNELKVSITDTGVGMDEDELKAALAPFNTGNKNLEAGWNGSGTGLGLTLVDSLIKLHGGELELVSGKGVGTTATIIFPSKRVAKQSMPKQSEKDKNIASISNKEEGDDKVDRTIH